MPWLANIDTALALTWVVRIVAISLIAQTAELWWLRKVAADDGIWSWPIVRRDFAVFDVIGISGFRPLRAFFDATLSYTGLRVLLVLRMVCALTCLFVTHGLPLWLLLVSTLLIALRWRGSFNGGSDFMTLAVLGALAIASSFGFSASASRGALWYIAIIACNSYFLAGLAKLRTANWRSGRALIGFMGHTVYDAPPLPEARARVAPTFWERHRRVTRWLSWLVIGLELSFPLALIDARACLVLIGCALMFHVGNAFLLGLNRFVLAWAASYPALVWCSQHMLSG